MIKCSTLQKISFCFLIFSGLCLHNAYAQNVGIGTSAPDTKLKIDGALGVTPNNVAAGATITIPENVTIVRITDDGASAANAASVTNPKEGQFLTILNNDAQPVTFASSFSIPAATGIGEFKYINGSWWAISITTGNSGNNWTKENTASTPAIKTDNQYVTGRVGLGDFSSTPVGHKLHIVETGNDAAVAGVHIAESNAGQALTIEESGNGSGIIVTANDNGSAIVSTSQGSGLTQNATGHIFNETRTSTTANITKIGVDISSTGAWTGTGAANIGLRVNVADGTTNYAALFNGGSVGIGTAAPAASLDVAGRTLKLSNTYPRYRWFFGGAQDTSWKKIADVSISTGSYRAVTFEVVVTDAYTNFGHSTDAQKMTFYVSMRRSAANQDDLNDAIVKGPSTDYVRAVKTATGVYELQVRQATNWRHMTVEAQVISELGATVTYIDNPANGSTSGTIYTSTGSIFYDGYWTRVGTSLYNTYQNDKVGIGTTTPGATLNVIHPTFNTTPTKPSGNWTAIIENNQDASDSRHGLSVVTRWGSSESKIFEAASYWNGSTQVYTPVLTVLGNRRVGIGTTSPANLLEVKGGHSDSQIRLFSDHYAQGINGANTAVMTLWASEPGVTWTGVGIGNNIYNTTNFPRLTTTRGGSYLRLLENQVNINIVNSSGTDIQAFAVLPGWEAGNGSIKVGNNHTINSHSNTWLYIGDQNKNVFGGTGLATGRIYTVNAQVIDLAYSGNVFVMADNNGVLYKSTTTPYANLPRGTMVGLCIRNTSSGCCNCNAGVKAPITGWGTCPTGYSWQQIAARWDGLNERWVYTCIKD